MSHAIVNALKEPVNMSFGMVRQYIEICPENIWVETSGGWPVWQQVYHLISAVSFFTASADAAPPATLVEEKYCALQAAAPPTVVITRQDMQTALTQVLQDIEALTAALDDTQLTARNEGLYQRVGMETTMAATLTMLSSHTLYHLGSCDAALRNHGLSGVF